MAVMLILRSLHAQLAQTGPSFSPGDFAGLGVIALALIAGQVLAFRAVVEPERKRSDARLQQEVERSERLDAEVKRLNEAIQEKYVPTLVTAVQAVTEGHNLLREFKQELELTRRLREHGPE